MCRSIKKLNLKNETVTEKEIYEASRQYIRKITGYREPPKKFQKLIENAILDITKVSEKMLIEIKK